MRLRAGCAIELPTNLREGFTITVKAPPYKGQFTYPSSDTYYYNLSPIAQERSCGEMSEVTKKVTTCQTRCGSSEGSLI